MNSQALIPLIQQKSLSKLQKEFNTKIRKIAEIKQKIEDTKSQAVYIKNKLDEDIIPLEQEVANVRVEYVKTLDYAYQNFKLSKKDQELLVDLVVGESYELISVFGKTELIELYDYYNTDGMSYAEEEAEIKKEAKKQAENMFSQTFGKKVDLSDLDEEAIFQKMHEMRAEFEAKQKQAEWEAQEKQKNRKRTPKQQEREHKRQAETEQLNKTTRAIYTELVKELHPDREQDEEARAWKTEIMKQITQAYESEDMFELLKLQLQYRQSQNQLDELPEERLTYYIKLLKEQIYSLQAEYSQMTSPFFGTADERLTRLGLGGTKGQVDYQIRRAKKELKDQMTSLEYTLNLLKDPQGVKQYLKDERKHLKDSEMDFPFDLVSIFEAINRR
ncbi:MAG: hypothetical protein MUE85_11470 [Microscillaceae bacterium]|jgi:hypothetical protein|nr:hypothetical protein [Microscillaceae bacterium]